MKLIKASFQILTYIDPQSILSIIEVAGRTCYKSEATITSATAEPFVRNLLKREHESVLEHQSVSARVICDRGVSHEIVRHRIASYSQESTRYCNYRGGVEFVVPPWVTVPAEDYVIDWPEGKGGLYGVCEKFIAKSRTDSWWFWHCAIAERDYRKLLGLGWSPQQARSVLPNSLKTEIVMTMNLREWRHFFRLRAAGVAGTPHPQMLEIAVPMLNRFKELIPVVFDDIKAMSC